MQSDLLAAPGRPEPVPLGGVESKKRPACSGARRGAENYFNLSGNKSVSVHSGTRRSRSALPMTDTELRLMAALAIIGLSSSPNHGYRTPAAMGTPRTL